MKIFLRGLPEGLIGKSEIEAESLEAALQDYPVLELFQEELEEVSGGACTARSFRACDG
ncbi:MULTISPECIES: hypothetical protein [Pseudomonas]|jgi:hypothetical protein|uniref:hypothetical protein n=1 Tax=Pseudomonas TaxID=286 RepID=UPI0013E30AFC|nr:MULTISPECIES: hypothetical protein [Pseudomonas]UQS17129.1 hypothetical protein JJN09_09830 [Pseudomonas sp. HS6]